MELALLAHVKKQAHVALPQGLRFDPPYQRRSLVLALLFFVNIVQRTRGDGGSRLRQPDDMAAAVRFGAPCCVAGCEADLNVTASGLVRGVTYRLLVVVARGGDAIYADETSITWSAEMAEKATPAGSHLFQRMLPPLPAGPHTVRATLLDAAADTTEDTMLSSMVQQLDPRVDRAAGATCAARAHHRARDGGEVAGKVQGQLNAGSTVLNVYVVSLQGVPGASLMNAGRLDAFYGHWHSMCGDQVQFTLCPGIVDERRGYGITQAFIECFDRAMEDGQAMAIFMEDDAVPFEPDFCNASVRTTLWLKAPKDALVILLGGHQWVYGVDKHGGFREIKYSQGAYGFAVPHGNLKALQDWWAADLRSGRPDISPDLSWYELAKVVGKRIFATSPLIVKHLGGYSNTWKRHRAAISGD